MKKWFAYKDKAIISGKMIEFYQYKDPIWKSTGTDKPKSSIIVPKNKDDCLAEKFPEEILKSVIEERDYRAEYMRRAKRNIERLAYCNFNNQYTSLMTLTYKANVKDLGQAYADLDLFMKRLKYPLDKYQFPFVGFKLKYICKPEFQERGAVHFHLITNLKSFPFAKKVVREWKKQKTLPEYWDEDYNLQDIWTQLYKSKGKGSADLQKIAWEGMPQVVSYITGYMTKDFDDERFAGKKSYSTTRNLIKPIELYNDEARLYLENLLEEKKDIKKETTWTFTPNSFSEQEITYDKYIV